MEKNELDYAGGFSTQSTQDQSTGVYGVGNFVNLAELSNPSNEYQSPYTQNEPENDYNNSQGAYIQ